MPDSGRQVIIMLPEHVNIIMLSATVYGNSDILFDHLSRIP